MLFLPDSFKRQSKCHCFWGAFLFHPIPSSLLPLQAQALGRGHDDTPPGDWFLRLPAQTESPLGWGFTSHTIPGQAQRSLLCLLS